MLGKFSDIFKKVSLLNEKVLNWDAIFKLTFSQFTAILIPCFINIEKFNDSQFQLVRLSQILSVILLFVTFFILMRMIKANLGDKSRTR